VKLRGIAGIASAAFVALSAGCGLGETREAVRVTDEAATLTGTVRNTEEGVTRYRFQYGPTTAYDGATPWRELDGPANGREVSEVLGGLEHGVLRHFRLCASDARGRGTCGADRTFTTTVDRDSAVGEGVLSDLGTTTFSATVDAHSGPGGAAPSGSASALPGQVVPQVADAGAVSCLRILGDRATIGVDVEPVDSTGEHRGRLIFIRDNGPSGDYLNHVATATPPTVCPLATDDRFIAAPAGQTPPFAALVSGDFQVHDHPASSPSAR
jgi:hypothetical protein